jgi:uncharacterized protein YggU (UPF0235/DUF167 family)
MYVKVKVKPGSKKEIVERISDDTFHISTKVKAERGEANKRVCEIIREIFNNPPGGVIIINGHHSSTKLLKVGED